MADRGAKGLESISAALGAWRGPAPVDRWNPPYCGDLDIRIRADGTWLYLGTPIGRPAMVRLFSSVLKREGDRYFLVTPVEKIGIKVDDVPFLAVALETEIAGGERVLHFRTNVDEKVRCDAEHRLRFETEPGTGGVKPYIHVRRGLWALVTRALFYDLVALGEVRSVGGREMFGIASAGEFFAMAEADTMAVE